MIGQRRSVLQEGRFGWCGKSGMAISDGYFWTRRLGGYNFYVCNDRLGGDGVGAMNFDCPVRACGPSEDELVLRDVFSPQADHWLAARTVSRFGIESEKSAWLRVRVDGELGGEEVPDKVRDLSAGLSRCGAIKLTWRYEPRLGVVKPSVFKIYQGAVDSFGGVDTPIGYINYNEDQKLFCWEDVSCELTGEFRFIVRSESSCGVDDGSLESILAASDFREPGIVTDVLIELT